MITMTAHQKKVYQYVLDQHEAEKDPPTVAEIAAATGAATSLVHRRIIALEKKGYLTRDGYRSSRNIRIVVRI